MVNNIPKNLRLIFPTSKGRFPLWYNAFQLSKHVWDMLYHVIPHWKLTVKVYTDIPYC